MAIKVSLKELVESGAHFGHQAKRWNPKMEPFIYQEQGGIHVIDLIKTKEALEEALKVIEEASKTGKKILFVGTKKQAKEIVAEVAKQSGSFFVTERFLGGTLTNFSQIRSSAKKLTDMKAKWASGDYKEFTKKERLLIEREIARLGKLFNGIEDMDSLPDLMVIVDTKKESGAVREAAFKGIETIGIVDTNSDPDAVDYPIPMNDDATKALSYVLTLMKEAVIKGKSKSGSEPKLIKLPIDN